MTQAELLSIGVYTVEKEEHFRQREQQVQRPCGGRKHAESQQGLDQSERVWEGSDCGGLVCFLPENRVVDIIMPMSWVSRLGLRYSTELRDQNL